MGKPYWENIGSKIITYYAGNITVCFQSKLNIGLSIYYKLPFTLDLMVDKW